MAINQSLPSSSLMLNIAPAPAPATGTLPVATAPAPAQAGFQLLFQGLLQAQGGRMLAAGEGKPLPPGGEPLPEGLELAEATVDGGVTGAAMSAQVLPEPVTVQATEAGGRLVQISTAMPAPADAAAPGVSAKPNGVTSPAGNVPAQAAGGAPAPAATVTSGAGAPSVPPADTRENVQGSRAVQQAAVMQPTPPDTQPLTSTTPARPGVSVEGATTPASRPQASALTGIQAPAGELPGGQVAQMTGRVPAQVAAAASAPPSLPTTAPASLQAGGVPSPSEAEGVTYRAQPAPPLMAEARSAPVPAGQAAATAAAVQPAPVTVSAGGGATPLLNGATEMGQRVPPSAGVAPRPEASVAADATDDGMEVPSVQAGNALRQAAVSSAQGSEVTDVSGGRDAALTARPDAGRTDASAVRTQAEAGAVRAEVTTAALRAAAEAGEVGDDGGQQSRQDGQNAAAQLAGSSRGSVAASVTTQPATFAEQLQQQMQQQLGDPRWGRQMGERAIMMAQHGPRSAQIQLDPPELGAMQIRIHVQGQDQVSVSFTSANPMVRDALEQQLPRLREMFSDQGLNLQDSSVSDEARQHGSDSRDRGSDNGGAGRYAGGGDAEDTDMTVISQAALGLVDYYA
ncbi:flagellar hook-length control protein FliK [Marinobacterium weihaiense]|uniref:Flagellar hook-length control protein FliK n=1 Tax=Marinobacterium weihaiense TaxID=2851016 RepID=A0ABS6MCL5_9GAMM|nr:flagellar hook-length control protein FliK [Marinobacterium weihaiense]MBV0934023.1 flagellar hook-length control protein FliK [Marinobacterium weihaiense]